MSYVHQSEHTTFKIIVSPSQIEAGYTTLFTQKIVVMSGQNSDYSRPLQPSILCPKSGHTTILTENTKNSISPKMDIRLFKT